MRTPFRTSILPDWLTGGTAILGAVLTICDWPVTTPSSENLCTGSCSNPLPPARPSELEQQLAGERQQTADATLLRQELDTAESEASNRRRELERSLKVATADRDGARRELQEAHEKLKLQGRELADALSQRKLAMAEYAEVSDK